MTDKWQPIETAPKGGGADMVTDPKWVEPPKILVYCECGNISVVYWEYYYAKNGHGCSDGIAWTEPISGEPITGWYKEPTHWMSLPKFEGIE